mmetsp:Transcript_4510/g.12632  ORF Transcript_4510/g.12632 Transcript_4510/m.12632 type:complete len:282 (+) Transcript_4510:1799-2644(+)
MLRDPNPSHVSSIASSLLKTPDVTVRQRRPEFTQPGNESGKRPLSKAEPGKRSGSSTSSVRRSTSSRIASTAGARMSGLVQALGSDGSASAVVVGTVDVAAVVVVGLMVVVVAFVVVVVEIPEVVAVASVVSGAGVGAGVDEAGSVPLSRRDFMSCQMSSKSWATTFRGCHTRKRDFARGIVSRRSFPPPKLYSAFADQVPALPTPAARRQSKVCRQLELQEPSSIEAQCPALSKERDNHSSRSKRATGGPSSTSLRSLKVVSCAKRTKSKPAAFAALPRC